MFLRTIVAELGRSPFTIGREVRRNRVLYAASGVWSYWPHAAQARADVRRQHMARDVVMTSERPAEVADRAVPGHAHQ